MHRVVERRNTIPILTNVLLRATDSSLALKATDLDLEILETVPAEIPREGVTTVSAHLLYDVVRKLVEGAEVSLETDSDGRSLSIRSGRSKFLLADASRCRLSRPYRRGEFPVAFTVAGTELRGLIDRTQFAISTEETRYYLNGIYLHLVTVGEAKMLPGGCYRWP